jgi:D-alanine-D-alanine ligase
MWRIVSYRSKWEEGSDEDLGAVPRCPAELPATLASEITDLALAAWRLVGGDGYGRVDFRIDRRGRPWLLEVNANPDISPHAGLARMARVAGLDYAALVREVCDHATARTRHAADGCWTLAQQLSGVMPAATASSTPPARLVAVGDH